MKVTNETPYHGRGRPSNRYPPSNIATLSMTVFTHIAILALVTNPACGNVDPNGDLAPQLVGTVMAESGGDQYAIGLNADPARKLPAGKVTSNTAAEAIEKATALLAQGRSIDLGLSQINDRQLARHHLTLVGAFDECANIRAGAEHLADDLAWVLAHRRYNSGSIDEGIAYAQRVTANIAASGGQPADDNPQTPQVGPLRDALHDSGGLTDLLARRPKKTPIPIIEEVKP